jgi:hypothetical protein
MTKPAPPRCDPKIFKQGEPIVLLDGGMHAVEEWVLEVARLSETRIDWHYSGGIAQVLHLGDSQSRERALTVMRKRLKKLNGRVLRWVTTGSKGLYRAGDEDDPLQDVPEGAVAGFMDPITGERVFAVSPDGDEERK